MEEPASQLARAEKEMASKTCRGRTFSPGGVLFGRWRRAIVVWPVAAPAEREASPLSHGAIVSFSAVLVLVRGPERKIAPLA